MEQWHKSRSFNEAVRHAWEGLQYLLQEEVNVRRHFMLAAAVLLLAGFLSIPLDHLLAIIIVIALVIALEMINAALELIEDVIHPEYHAAFKHSKDIMAAAVLVSSVVAVVVGLLVLMPPLYILFD